MQSLRLFFQLEADGKAVFANLQSNVRDVFEMTGFSAMLSVHDSLETALAAL